MMLPPFEELMDRLAGFQVASPHCAFRDPAGLSDYLDRLDLRRAVIGQSREGRELHGIVFGSGGTRVSIVAGSHADEPTGPMTAQALPLLLSEHFPEFLEACTFHVIPQINPDGAERNRGWFADPADFETYVAKAVREAPGDDVEFGFGDTPYTRPECRAAMEFLSPHGPFSVHASLHGMGFAEGAWFLICREWAGRAERLRELLTSLCRSEGLPLHDIERHGEKGFHRIAPGFCTTPTSSGMREFFVERDDLATASLFLPNSMEFARTLGGDPLCLVSEMPLFLIGDGDADAAHPLSARFRDALAEARSNQRALVEVAAEFHVLPLSFARQMKMQLAMLLLGIRQSAGHDRH